MSPCPVPVNSYSVFYSYFFLFVLEYYVSGILQYVGLILWTWDWPVELGVSAVCSFQCWVAFFVWMYSSLFCSLKTFPLLSGFGKVNKAATNMCIEVLSKHIFISFGKMLKNGSARSYWNSTFNFIRDQQAVL